MLPREFEERMRTLLKDESQKFFDEIENGQPIKSLRVNEIKLTREKFESLGCINMIKADFPPECYYTNEQFPGNLPCHHAGMIYMQDPSAMATLCAAEIKKGETVLDSCSAPGGKTTQLSSMVGDGGIVLANEYEPKRCKTLQGNVERLGCKNTAVVNLDTKILSKMYPDTFSVVLCDAPCSGEGMFRKNKLAIDEWSLENVYMCAERQREILTNVQACVAPGGKLIYSTCTFSLEENEMNVDWFLTEFSDFRLIEVNKELKKVTRDGICFDGCRHDLTPTRRFYPHVSKGEGQFIAVFERKSESEKFCMTENKKEKRKENNTRSKEAEALKIARAFLEENLKEGSIDYTEYSLFALNGYVYLKPDIPLPSHGVFAAGVCVGEISGKRIVPHHQLFSAYGTSFKRRVELSVSSEKLKDYLCGLEIKTDLDEVFEDNAHGYAAILADGCAVGGGKISSGVCKNHYPKGLRANAEHFR